MLVYFLVILQVCSKVASFQCFFYWCPIANPCLPIYSNNTISRKSLLLAVHPFTFHANKDRSWSITYLFIPSLCPARLLPLPPLPPLRHVCVGSVPPGFARWLTVLLRGTTLFCVIGPATQLLRSRPCKTLPLSRSSGSSLSLPSLADLCGTKRDSLFHVTKGSWMYLLLL